VQRSDDPVETLPLVETREELPEGQDPSPSVDAYNESFGTSFTGELLSVSDETTVADGGAPKLSLLWKSPKFMDETGGDVPTKKLRLSSKVICGADKQSFSSLQRSVTISDRVIKVPLEALDKKGLDIFCCFLIEYFVVFACFLI
jgi:hypothetical protein